MEKFSYNSYPDSTDSSPRSREIDFDNPPPWDDSNQNNQNNQSYKVKFMCSYGGKIQPRPHDNQLTYVNGETKILSVDRSIRFSVLASKLAAVCNGGGDVGGGEVTFKYQLPGEDLDALISVTNDDDLEHMMHEYDRLVRMSSKPARMRLFLFPVTNSGFGSQGSTQSDRDRFVDVLNTVPRLNEPEKSVVAPSSADFLFGSEKIVAPPPPSQPSPVVDAKLPVPVAIEPPLFNDPRVIQPDPVEIQRQMQEFQRLQIREQDQQQQLHQNHHQQEGMYRRKSNEDGGYFSPTYAQNPVPQPPQTQPTIPLTNPQAPPMTFWQGNQGGGVFPTQGLGLGLAEQQQQPVYMIPPPSAASVYHAPPQPQGVMRPQGNQGGYYPPMQRMAPDAYREQHQPAYSLAQSQPQVQPPVGTKVVQQPPPPVAFTSGPPPPHYSAVPPPRQVVGLPDTSAFTPQVSYPGGMGKQQVYYTEAPPPQQYHGIGLPVSGGMTELRTGPDGKIVAMNIAPKVSSQNSDSAV